MSKINIRRAIQNIRSSTTVYTPVVEMIVNAIQAIDERGVDNGKVSVRALRDRQADLDGGLPTIIGFEIEDNGIGFTDQHRDSFDTLYTDYRIAEGGKGFGRFTCLKYFEDLHVESVYRESSGFKTCSFSMGKGNSIVVRERILDCEDTESRTVVSLVGLKPKRKFEKKLSTVARKLVERLLPYFITQDYVCPEIDLSEVDGSSALRLNDFVSNGRPQSITEIGVQRNRFVLRSLQREEEFLVRIFKIYAPRKQRSCISLVAHKREVTGSALSKYIPEFEEEFIEKNENGEIGRGRNYIVKAYVLSDYLDNNVSLERGGFEFAMQNDLNFGISQSDIEDKASSIASDAVGPDITLRREKKKVRVQAYIDQEAPWHKSILKIVDLREIPSNPSNEEIELCLQKVKFDQESSTKREVEKLLSDADFQNEKDAVAKIVRKISGTSKNELIHYIALRRKLLHIFEKSLEVDESGRYLSEGMIHDIIFPRKGDTETTRFKDHNLWIVDERLNFTDYVSSDVPLSKKRRDRPDLLVYGRRVVFRGDNTSSNPITIFEFKKPQRNDFVNPSSTEDPVQQIVRYVNRIRDGEVLTPQGREVEVARNTPFYGFVVCDLTSKIRKWLQREKNFT